MFETMARTSVRQARRVRHRLLPEAPPAYYGWTRFSVFAPSNRSWRLTRGTTDEQRYRDFLWSPERMAPRCAAFLDLTVPQLQDMADEHHYSQLVLYSPEIPSPWKERLLDAAARYPVIKLIPYNPNRHILDHVQALHRHERPRSGTVVLFRLDDDDLLSADYLDQLSQYANPHDQGRVVTFARGYQALWHEGALSDVRHHRLPLTALGLAAIGHYDALSARVTVPSLSNHMQLDRRLPTILDSRRPTYVQLRHLGQDTQTQDTVAGIRFGLSKLEPVTSVKEVLRAFPYLESRLRDRRHASRTA